MHSALTRKQQALYDHLIERALHHSVPPTLDELCAELGLASRGSLHKLLQGLIEAGLVEPMQHRQRGVRLTAPPAPEESAVQVPFLGYIAAGRPIEAVTQTETVAVPAPWVGARSCYVLQVRGDSMIEDGIFDGDQVLIDSRATARNGDTVVALVDGHNATLKRLEAQREQIVLHPANAALQPQVYRHEQVQVQGVVRALLRVYA